MTVEGIELSATPVQRATTVWFHVFYDFIRIDLTSGRLSRTWRTGTSMVAPARLSRMEKKTKANATLYADVRPSVRCWMVAPPCC